LVFTQPKKKENADKNMYKTSKKSNKKVMKRRSKPVAFPAVTVELERKTQAQLRRFLLSHKYVREYGPRICDKVKDMRSLSVWVFKNNHWYVIKGKAVDDLVELGDINGRSLCSMLTVGLFALNPVEHDNLKKRFADPHDSVGIYDDFKGNYVMILELPDRKLDFDPTVVGLTAGGGLLLAAGSLFAGYKIGQRLGKIGPKTGGSGVEAPELLTASPGAPSATTPTGTSNVPAPPPGGPRAPPPMAPPPPAPTAPTRGQTGWRSSSPSNTSSSGRNKDKPASKPENKGKPEPTTSVVLTPESIEEAKRKNRETSAAKQAAREQHAAQKALEKKAKEDLRKENEAASPTKKFQPPKPKSADTADPTLPVGEPKDDEEKKAQEEAREAAREQVRQARMAEQTDKGIAKQALSDEKNRNRELKKDKEKARRREKINELELKYEREPTVANKAELEFEKNNQVLNPVEDDSDSSDESSPPEQQQSTDKVDDKPVLKSVEILKKLPVPVQQVKVLKGVPKVFKPKNSDTKTDPIPAVKCDGFKEELEDDLKAEYNTLLELLNRGRLNPSIDEIEAVRKANSKVVQKIACGNDFEKQLWKNRLQNGTFTAS
jgi:hypothetical protein